MKSSLLLSLGSAHAHLALVALLLGAMTSCRSEHGSAKDKDPVALEVGSQRVTLSQLQADLDDLALRQNPLAGDAKAFLQASTERLAALERAKELGLDQSRELQRQWENLVIGQLHRKEIDAALSQVSVSDAEIAKYYETHQAAFSRPAQVQLALLHLAVPHHSSEETKRSIEKRMSQARQLALALPADVKHFGALAMEYSDEATSRFKGGDVGWLQAGASSYRWPDEVISAAFALDQIGTISEVITAKEGFYLLRKVDARSPQAQPLEGRFRNSIANAVLRQKRQEREKQLTQSWSTAHPATVHQSTVDQLKFSNTPSIPQTPPTTADQ